jgi:2-polyprenyl-3-methyl-5-hydroxy-6-metoxy-1,4-benzoquinol methylase
MVYLAEIPEAEEISAFYETYSDFKGLARLELSRLRLIKACLADRNISILESSGGIKGLTLVEMGCSHGFFLQLARHSGARVTGVDLDAGARASLHHLNIDWRERLQGDERADIVCAFNLIEHLDDPQEFCSQVSGALVENGRFLLALPNGGESEQVGESWIGFRVDQEHLNYFSIKTLARLLTRHGLFVEQFWLHTQPDVAWPTARKRTASTMLPALSNLVRRALGYPASPETIGNGSFFLTVLARKTTATTLPTG